MDTTMDATSFMILLSLGLTQDALLLETRTLPLFKQPSDYFALAYDLLELSRLLPLVIPWPTLEEKNFLEAKAIDMVLLPWMTQDVSSWLSFGPIEIEGISFQPVLLLHLVMILNEQDGSKLMLLQMLILRGETSLLSSLKLVKHTTQLAQISIDTTGAGNPL